MRAVRDSEVASQSIGLDPTLIRTAAFALSAAVAGLAGGVFAAMSDFISPESFPFFQSILFLLVVMIGGADRVLGPLIGALVVVLLPELLSWLAQYRLLFVGVLLLVVLRLAPEGFVGLVGRFLVKPAQGRPAEAKRDVPAMLAGAAGRGRLAVEDLSVSFGGVKAVVDLSFAAEPGRITSIIGPNGAGKSTVLNLACGFYRPDRGSIRLAGREIAGLASHRVARAGIARTYQTTQLFGDMSVIDNVLVALRRGRLPAAELLTTRARPGARGAGRKPAGLRRLRRSSRAPGRRAAARRQAPGRDRPGAGPWPKRADARRAGGGARPGRHAAARPVAAQGRRDRRRRGPRRARHGPRHERLRPRRGARCRPEDRRGRARRGRPERARARGLPRRAAARRTRPQAAAGGRPRRQPARRRAAECRLRRPRRDPRHRSGRARRASWSPCSAPTAPASRR